jgi:predicted PurR-regulated permease PerM
MGIGTAQALQVSEAVTPWVAERVEAGPDGSLLPHVQLPSFLEPYQSVIVARLGELAGSVGRFLIERLAAATRGTIQFLFLLFVMLYAMFYFLREGPALIARIASYLPLSPAEERRVVERFLSVARATLKGTLVIGVVQGGLAGAAFAVVGLAGAAFWGTLMAVLSMIPGVGTALVWVPAAIYLYANERGAAALGLVLWCALVVGTVDNLLRPRLVGRDTQLPDLMILVSTLGGLILFGAVGILIGPLLAALFVTVWDIYGVAFRDLLPREAPDGAP